MAKQSFNAKKFLKSIKNTLGKRAPEPVEDDELDEDLDRLNEEQESEGEQEHIKSKPKSKFRLGRKKVFDKVGGFFDPEPQKQKVLSKEDFRGAGDVYFASVSAFYKVIERILWVLLAIFLVFSLITNYREITFNNFFYLLKDFSSAVDSETSNYQILSYDSDKRQKFALFRGGIVSASPSSVSVFTTSGRRTLRNNNEYYSPTIVACDKYFIVYDAKSSSFSVFNSFSKVYNEKFVDSTITDAVFDDDGSFAVATRESDTKTMIYLYGKNIKKAAEIPQYDYVFDMSLNTAEHKLATIAYEVGSGTGKTVVTVFDTANEKADKMVHSFSDEFPIACSYLESGELAVITNGSVRIFDKNLKQNNAESFYEGTVSAFNVSKNGAVAVVSSGTVRTAYAYNSKGDLVYNKPIGENIIRADIVGKYLFLQTASGVIRIDTGNNTREFLASGKGTMLVYSEDTAIVCGEAKAEYLVFNS